MVQGVIGRISDKRWNNKTFYSFVLNGQEGWFSTGMQKPPSVGTSVRFNDKTNNKGYKEVDGAIEILSDGQVSITPSVQAVIKANGTGGQDSGAYWGRKEARDVANDAAREIGASRNTALSIIDLALKYEVVKLPAIAKREEFLWNLLDRYTAKLMGRDKEDKVPDSEQSEVSAHESLPNEDEWN